MSIQRKTVAVTPRRLVAGALLALYLYVGLGASAVMFYELYHLIKVDFVYYFYSAFKAASYYLPRWPLYPLACVVLGLLVALPWWNFLKSRLGRAS